MRHTDDAFSDKKRYGKSQRKKMRMNGSCGKGMEKKWNI